MAFGRDQSVGIAFKGKDEVSPVVRGIRNTMDGFKRDAASGFGLGAGISVFNLASRAMGSAVDVMGDAVMMASDLAESQSKVDEVFGDSADEIHDWSDDLIRDFGLTERAAEEAAGTFGNFTQALGVSREESIDMSKRLVELAGDLAAFNNVDVSDVLVSLRSGIAGEAEPMRRLGADVSAARVETILLANGIQKVNGRFTEGQKVLGRYQAIMQDTKTAQGNFALTSDGLAGQMKILNAELETAQTELGEELLPIAVAFARFLTEELIPTIKAGADELNKLGPPLEHLANLFQLLGAGPAAGAVAAQNQLRQAAAEAREAIEAEGETVKRTTASVGGLAPATQATTAATADLKAELQALNTVASGGFFKTQKKDLGEAEKRWKRLKDGPDRNDRAIKRLEKTVRIWTRREAKAVADSREDRAALARSTKEQAQKELDQRRRFRDSLGKDEQKLGKVQAKVIELIDLAKAPIEFKVLIDTAELERARILVSQLYQSGAGSSSPPPPPGSVRQNKPHSGGIAPAGSTSIIKQGEALLTPSSTTVVLSPGQTERRFGGGGGNVYLDGALVGRMLDRRLGRQFSYTAAAASTRRSD